MTLCDRINQVRARLLRYREAEDAILSSQSYSLEGMTLTRANLHDVQIMINHLEEEIMRMERALKGKSRHRMRVIIPQDNTVITVRGYRNVREDKP